MSKSPHTHPRPALSRPQPGTRSLARIVISLCLATASLSPLALAAPEGPAINTPNPKTTPDFRLEPSEIVPLPGKPLALAIDAQGRVSTCDEQDRLRDAFGTPFVPPLPHLTDLAAGPDGRLYFFCPGGSATIAAEPGIAGANIQTPEEGAVLRSEPDGSHPEIFCRGLHDPRGLAFDDAGNLFTCDAASGAGDEDRWLYLVEHGDYGWRRAWDHCVGGVRQSPWIIEKLWMPRYEGQPAWVLPSAGTLPIGTSRIAHYPGTGFPAGFDDQFVVGNTKLRAIWACQSHPNGGSFLFLAPPTIAEGLETRDLAFAPDEKLYVMASGETPATGQRLWTLGAANPDPQPAVQEIPHLLGGGLKDKISIELRAYLKSPDQRVRLTAEWALVGAPDGESVLRDTALSPDHGPEPTISRLHAIWGLGMLARRTEQKSRGAGARMLEPLIPLLEDDDTAVRAQVARVLGEARVQAAFDGLIKALRNQDEHVSRYAAEALAGLGRAEALPQIFLMLRETADHDAYERHGLVDALLGMNDLASIEKAARDESSSVRMAALLAMRRLRSPEIVSFLRDEDPALMREAARAVTDENITEGWSPLAALIDRPTAEDALMRRVLDANFHLGQADNAAALCAYAEREEAGPSLRLQAVRLLGAWTSLPLNESIAAATPSPSARDAAPARQALERVLQHALASRNQAIADAAKAAAETLSRSPK